jgi:ATP-dependent Clp protease adapter protein ClpS
VESAASLAASLGHAEVQVFHLASALLRHRYGVAWFSVLYVSVPKLRAATDERLPKVVHAYRSGPPGAVDHAPLDTWLAKVVRRKRLTGSFKAVSDLFKPLNEADLVVAVRDAPELRPLFDAATFDLRHVVAFERAARAQAASRGDSTVTVEHALLGACLESSFRAPLEKAGIDVDALTIALGRIATTTAAARPRMLGKVETLCARACGAGNASHAETITARPLIIDMLRMAGVADDLRTAGFDAFELLYALVHDRLPRASLESTGAASLVVHNDDHSTMEFVVESLQAVLGWESGEAIALMTRIHEHGQGLVELANHDEAMRALRAFHERARERMMPLRVEMSAPAT